MQIVRSYSFNGKYSTIKHRIFKKSDTRLNNKKINNANIIYAYISVNNLKAWQHIS